MNTSYNGLQVMPFRPSDAHDWSGYAACADEAPDTMYPNPENTAGIEYAKAVCSDCPVVSTCLADAMDRGEPFGVWGGLTPDERRAQRRASYNRKSRAKSA